MNGKGRHLPGTPRMVKIAYVTDRTFLKPTLLSLWSLLQHLQGAAELHFWGDGLSPEDWADVEAVTAGHAGLTLLCKDIGSGYLEGAHGPTDYITAATMGRLFIPRLIDGYVLYIDGDTLVTGDVGPLFQVEMDDAYAGVVRDYHITHWLSEPEKTTADRDARLAEIRQFMGPARVEDYFNAGILLLNCDALRAHPALLAQMEDVAAASARTHGDQDHLNALFGTDVMQLDPAWNASWGRIRRHRGLLARSGLVTAGGVPGSPVILHYHGPKKPWRDRRWDAWSSRGRATLSYRRAMRRFVQQYPHLKPL
ncbi:glycosyltransferase family 8 protein [Paracoccus liaowanqingii]|uniref:Glycosyltransferase family 8 protein n=2 Tax=Paracoccus liaowanqingii TaxID=2560053 RepID=A0A4Z1CS00_9RHOB|nr:glycosyltransferase family 8 protein [Paracoccus liaowanqingii]